MSFVWKAAQRMRTPEDTARIVISVAQSMGVTPKGVVMALACIKVESDFWCPFNDRDPHSHKFPHDSKSADGYSVGYYQQQVSAPGVTPPWGWGGLYGDIEGTRKRMDLVESTRLFLAAVKKLPYDYNSNVKSAGRMVQDVQRSAYPNRYDEEWWYAQNLYNRVATTDQVPLPPPADAMLTPGPWTGDPIWLDEVLIAEGLVVKTVPGWDQDGHGDFKDIRGVVCHHTGGMNTPVSEIRDGFAHLPGPLAQIHLGRDGTVTIVCVGVAWHAGTGGAPWLPRGMANWHCIGIEAVAAPPRGGPHRAGWTDAQYDAYVKVCAAICRRIGVRADRVISHQEWDDGDPPTDEGKWDPGSIDMRIFRDDVQRRIDSFKPTGAGSGVFMALSDAEQRRLLERTDQIWGALFNKVPSESIYADPDEGNLHQTKDLVRHIDKFAHEEYVESSARQGVGDSIRRVARVAVGEGKVKDQWAIDKAKAVLASIPEPVLKKWQESLNV